MTLVDLEELSCWIKYIWVVLKDDASEILKKTNAPADESIIPGGAERFRYAEALSRASFYVNVASGFHDTSFRCLMKCDVDNRKNWYANVVRSGGTTIHQGFGEHMTNELTEKTYVLPDENIVTVGNDFFRRVETLFQPVSLARRFHDTSFQNHHEVRRRYPQRVIRNVVVSSGTTCSKRFFLDTTNQLTALSHPR